MGVCVSPMRPLNDPFLGDKGRVAFWPTWKRAAAFNPTRAFCYVVFVSYVAKAKPLGSVVAGWWHFQPNFPPLHLSEQGDV